MREKRAKGAKGEKGEKGEMCDREEAQRERKPANKGGNSVEGWRAAGKAPAERTATIEFVV